MTNHPEQTTPSEEDEVAGPDHDQGRARAVALQFHLDDATGILSAHVVPGDGDEGELSADDVSDLLERQGYAAFSFRPNALMKVVRALRDGEVGEYPLATKIDAEVSVALTADRLQALLTTTRAYGGAPATEERVRQAIADAGVAAGNCLDDAIRDAVAEESVTNRTVAQGVAPTSGKDSRFELLIDLACEGYRPRENDQGRVDHYLQRDFVIVEADSPLLKYYPATPGIAGRDVAGAPVAARDGKVTPLPKDAPGVCPHAVEDDVLVAEYKGHPVAIPGGVRVDKTLVLDHVDLRTGNVDFDGSVLVKGDVSAGVVIRATGDVSVKGSVENASLEAGCDIAVGRGVTGSESAMRGGSWTVHVHAQRDVHVAFAGGVRLRAGRDVVAKEYLSHCDTVAVGQVLVGQQGGHGLVVGGVCHGCQGLLARTAGTLATVATAVGAGVHDELRQAHDEAVDEAAALADQLQQLRHAMAGMVERARSGTGDQSQSMLGRLRRTIEEFERRATENDQRIERLRDELDTAQEAAVTFSGSIYPGVRIHMDEATLAIRREGVGGHFTLLDGEVAWQ